MNMKAQLAALALSATTVLAQDYNISDAYHYGDPFFSSNQLLRNTPVIIIVPAQESQYRDMDLDEILAVMDAYRDHVEQRRNNQGCDQ